MATTAFQFGSFIESLSLLKKQILEMSSPNQTSSNFEDAKKHALELIKAINAVMTDKGFASTFTLVRWANTLKTELSALKHSNITDQETAVLLQAFLTFCDENPFPEFPMANDAVADAIGSAREKIAINIAPFQQTTITATAAEAVPASSSSILTKDELVTPISSATLIRSRLSGQTEFDEILQNFRAAELRVSDIVRQLTNAKTDEERSTLLQNIIQEYEIEAQKLAAFSSEATNFAKLMHSESNPADVLKPLQTQRSALESLQAELEQEKTPAFSQEIAITLSLSDSQIADWKAAHATQESDKNWGGYAYNRVADGWSYLTSFIYTPPKPISETLSEITSLKLESINAELVSKTNEIAPAQTHYANMQNEAAKATEIATEAMQLSNQCKQNAHALKDAKTSSEQAQLAIKELEAYQKNRHQFTSKAKAWLLSGATKFVKKLGQNSQAADDVANFLERHNLKKQKQEMADALVAQFKDLDKAAEQYRLSPSAENLAVHENAKAATQELLAAQDSSNTNTSWKKDVFNNDKRTGDYGMTLAKILEARKQQQNGRTCASEVADTETPDLLKPRKHGSTAT